MIRQLLEAGPGRLAAVAAAALIVAVGAYEIAFRTPAGQPPVFRGAMEAYQPASAPKAAPEVSFTDAQGKSFTLADFRGRVVLLNFWATWCVPCVQEMPSLDKLQAKLAGPGFTAAAISVDRQGLEVVRPFLAKTAIESLPTYLDPSGAAMHAFGVRGLPTTMIIDAEGREAGRIEGMARWDTPEAEALIRFYVGQAAKSGETQSGGAHAATTR